MWLVQWIPCRLKTSHPINLEPYGCWLAGALAPAAIWWAYRSFQVQAFATVRQERSVFVTIEQGHYHRRFEDISQRLLDTIKTTQSLKGVYGRFEQADSVVKRDDQVSRLKGFTPIHFW